MAKLFTTSSKGISISAQWIVGNSIHILDRSAILMHRCEPRAPCEDRCGPLQISTIFCCLITFVANGFNSPLYYFCGGTVVTHSIRFSKRDFILCTLLVKRNDNLIVTKVKFNWELSHANCWGNQDIINQERYNTIYINALFLFSTKMYILYRVKLGKIFCLDGNKIYALHTDSLHDSEKYHVE